MRILMHNRFPKDVKLSEIAKTGVNGYVVCAIGDMNSFSKKKVDSFRLVKKQLVKIKKDIHKVNGVIATTAQDIRKAVEENRSVFILGIEGGDFIEDKPDRLEFIYNEGVRVFGPIHYSKNSIGSISFGWGGKVIPEIEQTGLTPFGLKLIKKANELGMVLDVAHTDDKTLTDIVKASDKPVMCSHTGPRNLQNFPRYISDSSAKMIADKGGIVGLWPYSFNKTGTRDLEMFSLYANHFKKLIGIDHIAIGTDINGVPGNMEGYENLHDSYRLIETFSANGFQEDEIRKVAAENFIGLISKILK